MRRISGDSSYILSVLQRFGLGKIRRIRNGYMALCPFHENHDTPAFSMSDNGLWICFSCSEAGNLNSFIKRMGGDPYDWKEGLKILGAQLTGYEKKKPAGMMGLPADFKTYAEAGHVPKQIMDRLEWDTIDYFELGVSDSGKNHNRCIIPIRYKNRAVAYHGRALVPGIQPKYYNSPGVDIKDYLFNYDECEPGKDLIVVEGAFNAMSMWEKGFDNVVATFGTKFSDKQLQLLMGLSPSSVTVCFDRDEVHRAGQKATVKMCKTVDPLVDSYFMVLPMGKDPNNLSAEVLKECFNNRIKYAELIRKREAGDEGQIQGSYGETQASNKKHGEAPEVIP